MAITDRTIELLVDVPVHAVQAELSQAQVPWELVKQVLDVNEVVSAASAQALLVLSQAQSVTDPTASFLTQVHVAEVVLLAQVGAAQAVE